MKWGSILVALSMMLVACSDTSPEGKKAEHLKRGIEFFDKGQLSEARIEFKNVVQISPKNAEGHYRLGLTYLKLGGQSNIQIAFTELNQSLKFDNSNLDARLKVGQLYLLSGQPSKAREQADLILASTPTDQEALSLRGGSYLAEKRYKNGLADLTKAVDLDPGNVNRYFALAKAFFIAGQVSEAEEILRKTQQSHPQSSEARVAMGNFFVQTNRPNLAEHEYLQALELSPSHEGLFMTLAGFYQSLGHTPKAKAVLKSWSQHLPNEVGPWLALGDFHKYLGENLEATSYYLKAWNVDHSSNVVTLKLVGHYLDIGQLSEAEQQILAMVKNDQQDPIGELLDARLKLARHQPDAAIALLKTLIKVHPQMALAHQFLGLAFIDRKEMAQALNHLETAFTLDPTLLATSNGLASIHIIKGSYNVAIEQATAALQRYPNSVTTAILLGDAYLGKGDLSQAATIFTRIIQGMPNEPVSHHRLGIIATLQSRSSDAIRHFEDAIKYNPRFFDPLVQIVNLLVAEGKTKNARARLLAQLDATPDSAQVFNLLGQLWMRDLQTERAEAAFNKALELDPNLLTAYLNLGELFHRSGRLDQAITTYSAAVAKDPKLVSAYMLLGIAQEQRKDYEQAKTYYKEALRINPRFSAAANNLARLMVDRGENIDVALSYAQTAYEYQPTDPRIADTLGWIYYQKTLYGKSLTYLKEAAEKLPNHAVVQYHYGMALFTNDLTKEAKHTLTQALAIRKTFPGAKEARETLAQL